MNCLKNLCYVRIILWWIMLSCVLTSPAWALYYYGGDGKGDAYGQVANTEIVVMESAADQSFTVGDAATAISTVRVTQVYGLTGAGINTTDDIRVTIPSGLSMVWDSSDTSATIAGGASAKVSATVSYENSDKTLVVAVSSDFSDGDSITLSGLSFKTFTSSASDQLDLEIDNAGTVACVDAYWKTIYFAASSAIFTGGNGHGYAVYTFETQPDAPFFGMSF